MQPSTETVAKYIAQVNIWQEQYGETMVCPMTGLIIPKTISANLNWRKSLRQEATHSEAKRTEIRTACAASYFFWVNAFGWTFHQKWVDESGTEKAVTGDASHVPFITWKIQDESAISILSCMERGEDILIDKARDMGASWLVLSIFQWMFQFKANSTFLELSRKEMYVDQRGNMDSLFEKHRYMLRMQPIWLRPKSIRDNNMLIENKDNGSAIAGESTNENAGQAGRKTAILIDEAARIKNLEAIDMATADTAACRIFNSTVNGPATWYTRIFRDIKGGKRTGEIITLPWEAHPTKGKGITIIDVQVTPTNPYGKKATSSWYRKEVASRAARDLAQNIDRDHGKSGDIFFDPKEVEQHRLSFEKEPLATGNIRFNEDMTEDQKRGVFIRNEHSEVILVEGGIRPSWKFWAPLIKNRPSQDHCYVFGVDISMGSGASNSVISVLDHDINMKIAEFSDAFTTPEDLAWVVCLAGMWFGGKSGRPLLIWETNGPGQTFGSKIMKIGYAPFYLAETTGVKSPKTTERIGWSSSSSKKEILFGSYRDALKNARYINPCKESLDEALDYVYNDKGLLVPSSSNRELGGASATHGDRVVADALCELGRTKLPYVRTESMKARAGSYAFLRDKMKHRTSEKEVWNK